MRWKLLKVGSRVYLRACKEGEPGTILRRERTRWVCYWKDLDFLSRHPTGALELAEPDQCVRAPFSKASEVQPERRTDGAAERH